MPLELIGAMWWPFNVKKRWDSKLLAKSNLRKSWEDDEGNGIEMENYAQHELEGLACRWSCPSWWQDREQSREAGIGQWHLGCNKDWDQERKTTNNEQVEDGLVTGLEGVSQVEQSCVCCCKRYNKDQVGELHGLGCILSRGNFKEYLLTSKRTLTRPKVDKVESQLWNHWEEVHIDEGSCQGSRSRMSDFVRMPTKTGGGERMTMYWTFRLSSSAIGYQGWQLT